MGSSALGAQSEICHVAECHMILIIEPISNILYTG